LFFVVVVEALYLDLEDLKESKSDEGKKGEKEESYSLHKEPIE